MLNEAGEEPAREREESERFVLHLASYNCQPKRKWKCNPKNCKERRKQGNKKVKGSKKIRKKNLKLPNCKSFNS